MAERYKGSDQEKEDDAIIDSPVVHPQREAALARRRAAGLLPARHPYYGSEQERIDDAILSDPNLVAQEAARERRRAAAAGEMPAGAAGTAVETTEKSGKLPDDFPGLAALDEAGIHTYAQVRKARDGDGGLTSVPGIGDATATKIEEAL